MPEATAQCTGDAAIRQPPQRQRSWARTTSKLPDLLALSFLFLLALAVLGRQVFLGGSVDDPDIALQSVPAYYWYSSALQHGFLPTWSPDILGGFPLAASQYAFYYPPDMLLSLLLDPARAFHLSLALHLALAGACAYWYARVLGLRRLPALLAAVAFQMGNEALSWPANGFITRTLFVLPALLAITELLLKGKLRYWLLTPVVVGTSLLGGYAQIVLIALYVTAAYAVLAVVAERKSRSWRTTVVPLGLLGMGVVLGGGLAAVRIAPTLFTTGLSTRAGGMSLASSAAGSIEPMAMVAGYLLPALNELARDPMARPDYVGGPVVFLALVALLCPRRFGRVPAFQTGLAGVTAILALGTYSPVYGLALQLPFVAYFRGPNRFSLVTALALAILAAYALQWCAAADLAFLRKWRRLLSISATLAGFVLASAFLATVVFQFGRDPLSEAVRGIAVSHRWDGLSLLRPRVGLAMLGLTAAPLLFTARVRGWLSHSALEWSLLALTVASLFVLGWVQNSWLPSAALEEPPAVLRILKSDPEQYRVFAWPPSVILFNMERHYENSGRPQFSAEFKRQYLRQFVRPNLGMLFGISTADGYEVLQSRRQALMTTYLGSERRVKATFDDGSEVDTKAMTRQLPERLDFLAALNVKYVLNGFPLEDPRVEPAGEVPLRIYAGQEDRTTVYLYRLKEALPRTILVPGARIIPVERDVLETLTAGKVDLRQEVVFEQEPPSLTAPALSSRASEVQVIDYRDDRVEIRAITDGGGFLVLMDFLLPGWSATVDGRETPILAANFAGRAVSIPGPGEHLVVFRYEAPMLREGFLLSLGSLVLVALAAMVVRRYGPRLA